MSGPDKFRFSIDRGGTFTDIYAEVPGEPGYRVLKLLSENPDHYPDASIEGIRRILEEFAGRPLPMANFDSSSVEWVRMGTTVATNALLEKKGARTGLLITRGFGDLLAIGKQNRPRLFDLEIKKPKPVYETVLEIDERIRVLEKDDPAASSATVSCISGDRVEILKPPNLKKIRGELAPLLAKGIESLAIVLMHSYIYPDHEIQIGELAREMGFPQVVLSSETMPRIKIVDRGQTACVDAYLTPHIRKYLNGFRDRFRNPRTDLLFMQSDGGLVRANRFKGCHAVFSGPAGGVVGYAMTAFNPDIKQPLIGFDMGGTSTDVSRFDGEYDWVHETEISGIHLQSPQLNIQTVAAGGGSRLFFKNGMLGVGPESSGAYPGPVCYRNQGSLSLTDANLLLGRLIPGYFPQIFGPQQNLPLDSEMARNSFETLLEEINSNQRNHGLPELSLAEAAQGFVDVANEVMSRPIREISVARGHDIRKHVLVCFGGAGGQHACAIARALGISKVRVPRFAGILSAYGLALADVVVEKQEPSSQTLHPDSHSYLNERLRLLEQEAVKELEGEGFAAHQITVHRYLDLSVQGTDTRLMIREPEDLNYEQAFREQYQREYGFQPTGRDILVEGIRLRAVGKTRPPRPISVPQKTGTPTPETMTLSCFNGQWREAPVYLLNNLGSGQKFFGPAIIINETSTLVVEPGCQAQISRWGDIEIEISPSKKPAPVTGRDPVQLAIFGNKFMSIAEQMGQTLQRTAISTNIKERQDFSCAIFDPEGGLVANAPHQPVHLGSMGEAVRAQIRLQENPIGEGDVLLSNHPLAGGTHLPDMTVITPVFLGGKPVFYVASRGHHADIGGISPGSMPPFSKRLEEEGAAILSFKLVDRGNYQEKGVIDLLTSPAPGVPDARGTRALADNLSDLKAQMAANQRGIQLLLELIDYYSLATVHAYMGFIQESGEEAVRQVLREIRGRQSGREELRSKDFMDDGTPVCLTLKIHEDGSAVFDFAGTGNEVEGNCNAPLAVTHSAVLYCLRCLVSSDIPLNQGCLNPVQIKVEEGSLLCPSEHAAVAGGNVLTSQRVTDVVLKAFGAASASQGCMNNLTFGDSSFGYYETIGGGAGAGPGWHGQSGVHTHMTNTRITDPEVLEKRYPVLLREFSIRKGSGGKGKYRGGDGLVREIEFLKPLNVAILSERRVYAPYGLEGGEPGALGENWFVKKDGTPLNLGGKNEISVQPGDRIRILTPGGGGYGTIDHLP